MLPPRREEADLQALVAYGPKHESAGWLADLVAEELERRGWTPDVRPAWPPADVPGFDLVVVGSDLSGGRWRRGAVRFVQRRQEELAVVPVHFFSSASIEPVGLGGDIPPTRQVARLMELVGAASHTTFDARPDLARVQAVSWAKSICADRLVGAGEQR
jgi:hypothetical protein